MKKTMLTLAAMLVALTGCEMTNGSKETVETSADMNDIAGVYTLLAVDGINVPATVSHGNHQVMVYSGTFTINADRTCSCETIFGPPAGEKHTRNVDATYTLTGSTLNMKWKGAGWTEGTVKDDTFTMNNEGMIFSYKKDKVQ